MPQREFAFRIQSAAVLLLAAAAPGCKGGGGESADPRAADDASTAKKTSDGSGPAEGTADDIIATGGPDIEVAPLEHGSLTLTWGDRVVYVDPVASALEAAGRSSEAPPDGDLIVVTHTHGDHLDPDAITRVRREGATAIVPEAVAERAGDSLPSPTVLANGESTQLLDGEVEVEAIAMYNLVRE